MFWYSVETTIHASIDKVWECSTNAEHIIKLNFATDDWCSPTAANNLQVVGKLRWRMEAKDGSFGFYYEEIYDVITKNKYIEYSIVDGRKVPITFENINHQTKVTEALEPETKNQEELQIGGCKQF